MSSGRSSRITELNDLARSTDGLSLLAASSDILTKSAVGFESAERETWKDAIRHAWAPSSRQNLSSSSSRFRGKVEPNYRSYAVAVGIVPSIESLRQFGRAEDHIFLNDLKKLREKFEEADLNGDGSIDKEEFINVFDTLFGLQGKNEEEILTFFNKIDYNCDGSIDWDEFCTYMYLEFHERDDVEFRSKKVEFQIPAVIASDSPHKDSICRIANFNDGAMVTCSSDGVICFWSHKLAPRRIRRSEPGQTGKPKWITDMALCVPQSKILLTTGDHELQFYEMQNFEPYCQLRRLDAVPLKLHFWHHPVNTNETIILIGDKNGALTILTTKNILEAFKKWKLGPKAPDGMPTYPINRLISEGVAGTNVFRWKLHTNWVSEVYYFPSLNNFASCSCDPVSSLVMGSPSGSTPIDALLQTSRQLSVLSSSSSSNSTATGQATPASATAAASATPPLVSSLLPRAKSALPARSRATGDQRVFRVPKGISTVDYCSKHNTLVTGSMDQIIRIWNPFIPVKPISSLFGQGSPIFAVSVESARDRIYSVGSDNTVKVWHILDYCCLYTIIPTAHKVFTPIEAFLYNPVYKCIAMGTEQLSLLKQVVPTSVRMDIVQSHSHPLASVRYSHCFSQVISACEGGIVKVWDIFTGRAAFEFKSEDKSGRSGQTAIDGISAIEIDKSGKRLVTGTQNGRLKLWNYNNGHCIKTLDKGNTSEVCDIKFVSLNNNKYVAAVGWDRKINLFPDVPLVGTQTSQKPIEAWSLASEHAHTEDILCVAFDASHLMATASFDGEILVWSVISCHVLARLRSPDPKRRTTPSSMMSCTLQDEDAVHKVLFLDKRVRCRVAATLVASGPAGYIHFWNVYDTSGPMGRFRTSQSGCVSGITVDTKNAVLVSADTDGYVCFWNIKSYCVSKKATQPPKKISLWRAHTQRISCIELVEECNVAITASTDGSLRLWTYEGHYIGTFGQEKRWQLGVPSTYQHPLAPSDTLLDPSNITQLEKRSSSLKRLDTPAAATTTAAMVTTEGDGQSEVSERHKEASRAELTVESVVSIHESSPPEPKERKRGVETSVEGGEKGTSGVISLADLETNSEDDDDAISDSLLQSYISTEVPTGRNISSAGKRLRHLRTNSARRQHPGSAASLGTRSGRGVYTTLPYQPLSELPKFKPPSSIVFNTRR